MNKAPSDKRVAKYTLDDVGCHVDSIRGIYVTSRVVEIAEAHGMPHVTCKCPAKGYEDHFANCEFVSEIEGECDEFMNDAYSVDGACWGRNDNGDWGLWPIEGDA